MGIKMKVKLLTDEEREKMDREIAEQEEQEKENKQAPNNPRQHQHSIKVCKSRKPSGRGSQQKKKRVSRISIGSRDLFQTKSQARKNEGSGVEFL